jgi:hypothetical protein
MNPEFPSPSAPSLVTCLMADRKAEAAQIRRTAEIPLIEPESPSRFRRLFATAVGYRTEIRRDPVAHGR